MINLLPAKYKKQIKKEYHSRLILVVLIHVVVSVIIAIIFLSPIYFVVFNQKHSLENQIQSLSQSETFQENTELNEFIKQTVADLGVFAQDEEYISPSDAIIEQILFHKRDDISITGISYNRIEAPAPTKKDAKPETKTLGPIGKISISGIAESREGLLSFAQSLDTVPSFEQVEVPIENFIVKQNIPFQINISYE